MESSRGDQGQEELQRAFETVEAEVPHRLARALRWVRSPQARWLRIPLGAILIVLSLFAWLPVIGVEFLPLGLLIIAVDVPVLRKPVARAILWLEEKWVALRRWWRARNTDREAIRRAADNLVALYGPAADQEALARARHDPEPNGQQGEFWRRVKVEIRRRQKR